MNLLLFFFKNLLFLRTHLCSWFSVKKSENCGNTSFCTKLSLHLVKLFFIKKKVIKKSSSTSEVKIKKKIYFHLWRPSTMKALFQAFWSDGKLSSWNGSIVLINLMLKLLLILQPVSTLSFFFLVKPISILMDATSTFAAGNAHFLDEKRMFIILIMSIFFLQ